MRNRAHEAAIALGRVDGSIKTKQRVPHVLAENGNYVGGGGGGGGWGVTPVYSCFCSAVFWRQLNKKKNSRC